MSDTTYIDYVQPAVSAEWLNEINDHVWHDTPVATRSSVHESDAIGYTPAGTGAVTTTVQEKLRESVSVKDFGAACDGTTDDSTALFNANAAAVAKNVPITIPAKMHIPSPVTITAGLLEDYATLFSSTSLVTVDGGGDKLAPTLSLNTMGLGGSAAQNKSAMQFALDNGGAYTFEPGGFTFDTGVTSSYASQPSLGSFDTKRYDIRGASMNNSVIFYGGTGFWFLGEGAASGQGLQAFDRLSNFSLKGTTAYTNYGVWLVNKVCPVIDSMYIAQFAEGVRLDGVFSAKVTNLKVADCTNGIVLDGVSGIAAPNLLTIEKTNIEGCSYVGINGKMVGDNLNLDELDIEGCGTAGNASTGGVILKIHDGLTVPIHISRSYFELNRGGFDLYIENSGPADVTVILDSCFFNRADAANHTTNNVVLRNVSTGTVTMVVRGCAFQHVGNYVPSAAEPYFNVGAGCELINGGGNSFSSTVPIPNTATARPGASSVVYAGSVAANGTVLHAPNGITVIRQSAGRYWITHAIRFGEDINGYIPTAICAYTTNGLFVQRVVKLSEAVFEVYTSDTGPTPTDAPFYFTVVKLV